MVCTPLKDMTNTPLSKHNHGDKNCMVTGAPSFMAPTAATSRKVNRDPSPRASARSTSSEREKTVTAPRKQSVPRKPPIPRRPEEKLQARIEELEDIVKSKDNEMEVFKTQFDNANTVIKSLEAKLSSIEIQSRLWELEKKSLIEKWKNSQSRDIYNERIIKTLDKQIAEHKKELCENNVVIRKLLNDVVDLKGQIRVAIRVRPALAGEDNVINLQYPSPTSIRIETNGKPSTFEYQKVYGPNTNQQMIFDDVEELVMSSLHGYNVAIVAFGQTGSGKTHTMIGGHGEKEGLIPRSARSIFRHRTKLAEIGWAFEITASFLEVHVEEVYDLLNDRQKLQLRMNNGVSVVEGSFLKKIESEDDINWILHTAGPSRSVAATKCSSQSSRSHAIFQIKIVAKNSIIGTELNSSLSLVDLAGSERAKESGSDENKERFREMTCINLGLSSLQKCIRSQLNKNSHIPYRDSKLTQLLMNSLGGGESKTMVIVGVNPSFSQDAETKRSLDFAQQMSLTKIGVANKQTK